MKNYLLICVMFLSSCGGASSPSHPASGGGTTYAITSSADSNGTISPLGTTLVNSGDNQSFIMTCNTGFSIATVTVDGSSVLAISPYTFTNVTATHSISFTCATTVANTISAVQAAWAATPYITGNTVQYFCDCTGAGESCATAGVTQGSDSNDGSQAHPKQTMTAARNFLTANLHATAALCQGGSFSGSGNPNYTYRIGRTDCPAGTICQELREYPVGGTNAKPIIINPDDGAQRYLFFVNETGDGGIRILNLTLQGGHTGTNVGVDNGLNWGVDIYSQQHDWTVGNVTFNDFAAGVISNGGTATSNNNITITGNTFNRVMAFGVLGGADNMKVNYNTFINTGGDDAFDHAIYTGAGFPISGIEIIGNYISGFSTSYTLANDNHVVPQTLNTQCIGVMISGGGEESNIVIRGNTMVQNKDTTFGGCYGIAFGNHGYDVGGKLNNVVVDSNVIVNPGNLGIMFQNCQDCVIENNLVYSEMPGTIGIQAVTSAARTNVGTCTPDSPVAGVTCVDQVSARITVKNNTVYSAANNTGGGTGIDVGLEGTGYVIANNTYTYMASAAGNGVNCFNYGLATSAYTFVDNNHCYSAASHNWEKTTGDSLATWQSATGLDTGSFQTNPSWGTTGIPSWSSNTTGPALWAQYFKPVTAGKGTDLIGVGNNTYKSALDILGVTRPNPPDIGAYTH